VIRVYPPEPLPQFGAQTPLGRLAQLAELMPPHMFLASQRASYVSGEPLTVTGGMPMP
jgi:NAD(P)-dependent dehydrogenase (short-subunit alcohol dehydrogenase family)